MKQAPPYNRLLAEHRERHRIKRKRKAQHQARMEYWERRTARARLRAEAMDPGKVALAMLELANAKLREQAAKPFPRGMRGRRGHRGDRG